MKNACSALCALQFILTLHSWLRSMRLCLLWRALLRENLIHQPLFNDSHLSLSCYCSLQVIFPFFLWCPVHLSEWRTAWKPPPPPSELCLSLLLILLFFSIKPGAVSKALRPYQDDESHWVARLYPRVIKVLFTLQATLPMWSYTGFKSLLFRIIIFWSNSNAHQLYMSKRRQ